MNDQWQKKKNCGKKIGVYCQLRVYPQVCESNQAPSCIHLHCIWVQRGCSNELSQWIFCCSITKAIYAYSKIESSSKLESYNLLSLSNCYYSGLSAHLGVSRHEWGAL